MVGDRAFFVGKAKRMAVRARNAAPTIGKPNEPRFTATLTPDELDGGWIAECLEVPGAMSQGETREEAVHNLIDAILEVMAVRMAEHKPEPMRDQPEKVALCYG